MKGEVQKVYSFTKIENELCLAIEELILEQRDKEINTGKQETMQRYNELKSHYEVIFRKVFQEIEEFEKSKGELKNTINKLTNIVG